MTLKFSLLIIACTLLFKQSIAQVSVSPLTGAANLVIPVYTVYSGQVTVPISLSYGGNGIKPKDVEGTAGMGWQLNAGGQVSRVLRGLPDDCTKDNSGATALGWMSTNNTGATYASGYAIQNNGGSCANGTADVNNINNNVPYYNDTEPDMFYISAPGLSVQMVYDRNDTKFHPVSYQDLQISYTTVSGTGNNAGNISSFTIVNDRGIKYYFAAPESVTQTTTATVTPNYFATRYKQYQNGVTYNDVWNLVSITDPNGNGFNFSYNTALVRNSTDPVAIFIAGSNTQTLQYKILQATTAQLLTAISPVTLNVTGQVVLTFNWNSPVQGQSYQTYIAGITGMGRTFQFSYNNVSYMVGHYTRAFLTGFIDGGCSTPVSYQFAYNSVNTTNNTTSLADSTSNAIDYWGYYAAGTSSTNLQPSVNVNPSTSAYARYAINTSSTPGAAYPYTLSSTTSRAVTASSIPYGALSTITYAQGGTTSIVYEPNSYYDVPSNSTVQGGGIRVKQIVDNPATGTASTRNYTYVNSSGFSSGAPVTLPQFAFQISYGGSATGQTLWTNATALSAYDLSIEDHTVVYSTVKMSQTEAGSTVFNYNVPGTNWSATATPACTGCTTTEWYPTIVYAGNSNCANTIGPVANLPYTYPFPPNPNYDFERGLPLSIINYNDAGVEVSETDYTYQRPYSPVSVLGFKSDDATSAVKFYGHYIIFYNTGEVTATVAKKVYDLNSTNSFQTSSVTNSYTSAFHKLLTRQSVTNSDNSITNTFYTYIKDYAPNSGATNGNIGALYNLQQLHVNAPVESYQQVTHGSTTLTTSASLMLYNHCTVGAYTNYLPAIQFKLVQPDGAAFTPFSINTSAQTTTHDAKYFVSANLDQYDNTGHILTADDNNKNFQTSYFDHLTNQTTAVFKNAKYNEVAFNDFDSRFSAPLNTFTITGSGSFTPTYSHSGQSAGIAATTQTVTAGTIVKNTGAKNYIFSIWISAATAGTLNFSGTGVSTVAALNYPAGAGGYVEVKIPATALSTSFTLSFTSSQNISVDDIILYPDISEVSSVSYDPTTHFKVAETNTNGISAYYTNDNWGRLLYAFDQDKNIVARKQYFTAKNLQSFLAPVINFTPSDPSTGYIYTGADIAFNDTNAGKECDQNGETYSWTFSDNTGNPTTGTGPPPSQYHVFSSPGTYSITLTKNSPIYGTKTTTVNVTVVTPSPINITYTNSTNRPNPGVTGSKINSITFYSTSLSYSFTEAQLLSGNCTIDPGTYQVTITASGIGYNVSYGGPGYTVVQSRQSNYYNNNCFTNTNTSTSYISTNYNYNGNYPTGNNYSIILVITNAGCSN